jgi:hypothetical protein
MQASHEEVKFYLTSDVRKPQRDTLGTKKLLADTAILLVHPVRHMEPNSLGRKLGIGMRVAGNIARERAAAAARQREAEARAKSQAAVAQSAATPAPAQPSINVVQRGRKLGEGLGRGTKSFSQSFFGPLAHAGTVLWLEITGCFFALFAAFFAQNVYQLHAQYARGPQHQKFLLYVVLTAIFVYFSASSFVSARNRARKQRAAHQK